MQLQIILMLIAITKEMDDSDMELQMIYIQSLAQQMVLCDVIAAMIRISHIERALIPNGTAVSIAATLQHLTSSFSVLRWRGSTLCTMHCRCHLLSEHHKNIPACHMKRST